MAGVGLDWVVAGSECGRPSPAHRRIHRRVAVVLDWCNLRHLLDSSAGHENGSDAPTKAGFY